VFSKCVSNISAIILEMGSHGDTFLGLVDIVLKCKVVLLKKGFE
jgi:hypothetical protein